MDMRVFLFSATVMMAMTSCQAAPGNICQTLINTIFNEDLPLPPKINLHVQSGETADVKIDIQDAVLGETKVVVSECTNNKDDNTGIHAVVIDMTFKTVGLTSPNVTLSGTLVDHIELRGSGPGNIFCEDLRVKLTGSASTFSLLPPKIHFDDAKVELDLSWWTVELEGMMPGTDLNAVLNEFLSMVGPELFEIIEMKLNSGDGLLNIINCIFPTAGTNCSKGLPARRKAVE